MVVSKVVLNQGKEESHFSSIFHPLSKDFSTDWTGKWHSKGQGVLLPREWSQLEEAMSEASTKGILLCIQAGKTSLVAGSVPSTNDEFILNLQNLPKEIQVHEEGKSFTASSNCTLKEINDQLERWGRAVPVDLPAVENRCTIGGVVSCNAGGQRRIFWGALRGHLQGLEMYVLQDVKGFELLKLGSFATSSCFSTGDNCLLEKASCGFDLMQLVIGSEGTLGVIKRVTMKTVPIVEHSKTKVVLEAFNSFQECINAMMEIKTREAGRICLLEMWDQECMSLLGHYDEVEEDLKKEKKFFLLSQILSSSPPREAAENDAKKLLSLRSQISTSISKLGPTMKFDLGFASSQNYYDPLFQALRSEFPQVQVFGYGHFGEGNLHLNIVLPALQGGEAKEFANLESDPMMLKLQNEIEIWVFERVRQLGGCPASEHGIGQAKARIWKEKFCTPLQMHLMGEIKRIFDPKGLLNPGKIFYPTE